MIDPTKPLELDNGVAVEYVSHTDKAITVRLPVGQKARRGEGRTLGRCWVYSLGAGIWCGGTSEKYLTLRNRAETPQERIKRLEEELKTLGIQGNDILVRSKKLMNELEEAKKSLPPPLFPIELTAEELVALYLITGRVGGHETLSLRHFSDSIRRKTGLHRDDTYMWNPARESRLVFTPSFPVEFTDWVKEIKESV